MELDKKGLSLSIKLSYFIGAVGYTIPFFLVALYWINFYNPPEHENLTALLYREPIMMGISLLSIIILLARFIDIAVDPLIAYLSDRSRSRGGRRLPFLKFAVVPAAMSTLFIFIPPDDYPSLRNMFWVFLFLGLCVTSFSAYVTPFLAHMSTLCKSEDDRLNLSTFQGVGESIGIIVAGQAPLIWTLLMENGLDPLKSRQVAFAILCGLSLFLMLIPIITLRGTDPQQTIEYKTSFLSGIKQTLSLKNFTIFIIANCIFVTCVEMVQGGAFYYVTVLLSMDAKMLSLLIAIMVPASLISAPIANILAKKYGKKNVMLGSFLLMALIMAGTTFLGKYPISLEIQAYILFFLAGIPLGSMSILLMAIVTDIAEQQKEENGDAPVATLVAGKNFSHKSGIALGAAILASLLLLGKDRGDDLGIRISCALGFIFCLVAFSIILFLYNEKSDKKS